MSLEILAESSHLRLVRRDGWDFVQRITASGAVIIPAQTDDGRVLFVEQFRPPVNRQVIEFPAGLVGDVADAAHESAEVAARRELLEETGYEASSVRCVFVGASSSGMSDEVVAFCVATGLQKVDSGGGVGSEQITIHEVPRADADRWLAEQSQSGRLVGARVFSGLYLLDRETGRSERDRRAAPGSS